MKLLNMNSLTDVTGGNGSGNWEAGGNNRGTAGQKKSSSNNGGGYYASLGPDVNDCDKAIIVGMVTGAITGGYVGMTMGLAGAAFTNCIKSGNGNGGGSGSNSNCGDNGCSW